MSHQHSCFKVRRAEWPVPGDHIGPAACNWRAPGDLSSHPTPSDTWAPAAALECSSLRKHSTTTGETEAGQEAVENPLLDLPAQPVPCWAGLGEELSLSGPQTRLQQRPHCVLNTCREAVCWWHLAVHSVGAPPSISACSLLTLMVCLSCALGQLEPQLPVTSLR